MATIIITGAAGFIGSTFTDLWLNDNPGDYAVCIDLLTYAGDIRHITRLTDKYPGRLAFLRQDICNLNKDLLSFYKPQYFINVAAETHNSRAVFDPKAFLQTNVLGSQAVLQACLEAGVPRIVMVSTDEIFGDLALDEPSAFTEDSPLKPRNVYSASKAAGVLVGRAYFESFGLPVMTSVGCNTFGVYQNPEKLIPHFITKALNGEKLPLYKSSHNRREWMSTIDHARALSLILKHGKPGEAYNIGTGIEKSIEDIANIILGALGLPESLKTYVDDRPGHDRRYLLDSTKIRTELGWEPKVGFDEGIADTISWYVNNKGWWESLIKADQIDEAAWASKG